MLNNHCDDLVTVIMPIYNVSKYIRKAVESVIDQTYHNIEIILIDDGSTDDSGDICDYFAKAYRNIFTFHKENGGSSSAREAGIEHASGEYITFLDGDDWFDKDFVDNILSIQKKTCSDICVGNYRRVDSQGNQWMTYKPVTMTCNSEEALKEMLSMKHALWELSSKFYKRSLFKNFHFDNDVRIAEDLYSNWILYQKASCVSFTEVVGYNYYERNDSITHDNLLESNTQYIAFEKIYESSNKVSKELKIIVARFCLKQEENFFVEAVKNSAMWGLECAKRVQSDIIHIVDSEDISPDEDYIFEPIDKIIQNCNALEIRIIDEIKSYFSKHKYNYIYGHGVYAMKLKQLLNKHSIKCDGFIISQLMIENNHDKVIQYDCKFIKSDHIGLVLGLGKKARTEVVSKLQADEINDYLDLDYNNEFMRFIW